MAASFEGAKMPLLSKSVEAESRAIGLGLVSPEEAESTGSTHQIRVDQPGEDPEREHQGDMSFWGAVFNLTCTIVGAGTLTMPYIYAQCGWAAANCMSLCVVALTLYSVYLLVSASSRVPGEARSFESLGYQTCGVWGSIYAQATFIFGGIGTLTGYMIFIGKLIAQAIGLDADLSYIPVIFIVTFIILPLACSREINALRYVSLAAMLAMSYIATMYCYFQVSIGHYDNPSANYVYTSTQALTITSQSINSVNLLLGAFCVNNTCLPVYSELANRSTKQMLTATVCAIVISFTIYEVIGLNGYILFGGNVQSDSLLNMDGAFQEALPWTGAYVQIAKLSMSLILALITPLSIWPCRSAVCSMISQVRDGRFSPSQGSTSASTFMFRAVTIAILAVVTTLSKVLPDVSIPLGVANSLAGGSMICVMPGMFYLGSIADKEERYSKAHRGAVYMIVLGVVTCVLGFTLEVHSIWEKYG